MVASQPVFSCPCPPSCILITAARGLLLQQNLNHSSAPRPSSGAISRYSWVWSPMSCDANFISYCFGPLLSWLQPDWPPSCLSDVAGGSCLQLRHWPCLHPPEPLSPEIHVPHSLIFRYGSNDTFSMAPALVNCTHSPPHHSQSTLLGSLFHTKLSMYIQFTLINLLIYYVFKNLSPS